jgi:hypothetical protein
VTLTPPAFNVVLIFMAFSFCIVPGNLAAALFATVSISAGQRENGSERSWVCAEDATTLPAAGRQCVLARRRLIYSIRTALLVRDWSPPTSTVAANALDALSGNRMAREVRERTTRVARLTFTRGLKPALYACRVEAFEHPGEMLG